MENGTFVPVLQEIAVKLPQNCFQPQNHQIAHLVRPSPQVFVIRILQMAGAFHCLKFFLQINAYITVSIALTTYASNEWNLPLKNTPRFL